jgi:hypothetical protein
MSQNPKERTEDSKKVAENNLKEAQPLDKQDPTQTVEEAGVVCRQKVQNLQMAPASRCRASSCYFRKQFL